MGWGSRGWWGLKGGVSRCNSIDLMPKCSLLHCFGECIFGICDEHISCLEDVKSQNSGESCVCPTTLFCGGTGLPV